MKSPQRYVTLLAAASLLLAGTANAQSSSGAGAGSSGSSTSGSGTTRSGSSTSGSGSSATGSSSTNRTGAAGSGASTTTSGSRPSDSTLGSTSGASSLGSGMSQMGAGAMARVSKDSVSNRLTAKDLIGAAVYDPSGERIGDIADIDLHGAVPGSLRMSFNQAKSDQTSTSGSRTPGQSGSGNYATTTSGSQTGSSSTGTGSSTAGTTGSSTTSGGTASGSSTGQSGAYAQATNPNASGMGSSANANTGTGTSSTGTAVGSNRATSGSSASDALRDSSRAMASTIDSAMSSGATVFVSVGGLWGIGDDLVSVPVSMLSYNTSRDHFEVSASKAEVVALTEDRNSGYASDSRPGMGATASGTTAGKQSFGDEVTRVQSALRSDPQTSRFAQNVIVTSDGETLELRGTVETDEQKEQIVNAARRATSLKIDDDELDVSK